MSAMVAYAKTELLRLGNGQEPDDEYSQMGNNAVLEMVETFAKQGHSGFSAAWTLGCLKKLLEWEPLSPLTGDDAEWTDIGEMNGSPCWQNNRCSRVFKDGDGRAYDIEGRVFTEANGGAFTGRGSRVYVTFPYTPTTVYVPVGEDGEPLEGPSREELAEPRSSEAPQVVG